MIEIGGLLEYKKEYFSAKNNNFSDCIFFKSGREALRYLVNHFEIRTLYLPSYFCDEVPQYLRRVNNLVIKEYIVDELFRIGNDALAAIKRRDKDRTALLMVDFFGRRDPNYGLVVKMLKKKGIIIFSDRTHSALNTYKRTKDAEFVSIRKLFINLPGSYVEHVKYEGYYKKLNVNSSLALLRLKNNYLKDHDIKLKAKFLKRASIEEKSLANFPKILKAIKSSRLESLLNKADLKKMKMVRQNNYNTLFKHIGSNNKLKCLDLGFRRNETPAFVLIKCSDYQIREKFKTFLIKNGIYPPVHWPNKTKLSKLLLSIPIDHRYSQNDMLFAASVINNFKVDKL
jgi:hypothetical protein